MKGNPTEEKDISLNSLCTNVVRDCCAGFVKSSNIVHSRTLMGINDYFGEGIKAYVNQQFDILNNVMRPK